MIKFEDIIKMFKKTKEKTEDEDLTCQFHGRIGVCTVKFGNKEMYDKVKEQSKNDKFSPWIFN